MLGKELIIVVLVMVETGSSYFRCSNAWKNKYLCTTHAFVRDGVSAGLYMGANCSMNADAEL